MLEKVYVVQDVCEKKESIINQALSDISDWLESKRKDITTRLQSNMTDKETFQVAKEYGYNELIDELKKECK
jgi:hypothetical protein